MALKWFLQLLSLMLVLNADTCCAEVPPCGSTWFGSPCRYKCHCEKNKCDNKGECTESTGCEKGWFGPACQYVDLVSTNTTSSTPAWVYDFPDLLCNPGQETVKVSVQDTYYFTWLRLRANVPVNAQNFKLKLLIANSTSVECSNNYTSIVSDTILDIHCQPGEYFQELVITGSGVKSLCSVYVSGGRNVALGQDSSQSSVLGNHSSWHAVDGDSNPRIEHESCTHTNLNDHTPTWILTFDRPHQINRYRIYNRDDLQVRLRGFILAADQQNGSVAFNYTDQATLSQSIYTIQSNTTQIPVSRVKIIATYMDTSETYLAICEVEMFGDSVCPTGQYGRECENRCNCARDGENCFISTGGCPSGCAAGYQGEGCQNYCNSKFWGDNCTKPCSVDCQDELCNAINGNCISCVANRSGKNCEQDTLITTNIQSTIITTASPLIVCNHTFWGKRCSERCSSNCYNQLCNPIDGTCISCVTGKSGLFCDQALTESEDRPGEPSPHVAVIVGPVAAFVVLVVLIVVGVLIWRRCRHRKDEPGQTTSHSLQDYGKLDSTQTEESSYAMRPIPHTVATPVIPKPNNQGNKNTHQHHPGYYNFVISPNETSRNHGNQEVPMAEHRGNYKQEQSNRFPKHESTTVSSTSSSRNQNIDRMNSGGNTYSIPTVLKPVDQQLRSGSYVSDDEYIDPVSENLYDVIRDSMCNPYQL